MSFWNFLGGFAIFNSLCSVFSSSATASCPHCQCLGNGKSCDRIFRETDIDSLERCIDEFEDLLADCDVMSEDYAELQERIDGLRHRLDEMIAMSDTRDNGEAQSERIADGKMKCQ